MDLENHNLDKRRAINIIIADDHSLFLEGVTALITSKYINVVANCKNGQEVLDFLKEKEVDLVISDINMPVIDGITLLNVMSNICYKKFNKDQKGLGVFMDVLFKSCEK